MKGNRRAEPASKRTLADLTIIARLPKIRMETAKGGSDVRHGQSSATAQGSTVSQIP
ncbi:MAG: hypothetical protein K2Z81_22590 [Cyanobacteria bacterium]|nr:hypothetical protein [Cyanobacteriota bacterium]